MIIPSIDIQNGQAVQLLGGKEKIIDGGDPFLWAKKFGIAGQIAIIDLDAAMGKASNKELILPIIKQYNCRVGGGIRTAEDAISYLDAGAEKVIIGTKASAEFLKQLPKERTIAALDCRYGDVVIDGWNTATGINVENRILQLKDYVSGFLITLVETEGSLKGIDLKRCIELKNICGDVPLTVAGGVNSIEEIAILDKSGIDVQVGMALYSGKISYAEAFLAPALCENPDRLIPTVVCDERGVALGLVWSNKESVKLSFEEQSGIYYSRSRKSIWKKGETSGATQKLLRVDLDCDRDTLRFTVRQKDPGFCHTQDYSCWGRAFGITKLEKTIQARMSDSDSLSYTKKLIADKQFLNSKILEETLELIDPKANKLSETADLLYFSLVNLVSSGYSISDVELELQRRALKVTRRY